MKTFGQQLRLYRRQSRDPQRGGLLTQERLGELIGQELGDAGYSGAAVSDWERDKSKIHADDRFVLVALLSVLYACGAPIHLEDANDLLLAGNFRRLDAAEAGAVFPDLGGAAVQALFAAEEGRYQAAVPQQSPGQVTAERTRTQRILLDKVENFWVDGVLKKSVADAPVLNLSKTTFDEAVDHPWEESLGPALIAADGPIASGILALFNSSDRALLILGSPGSGKTMTLIALAGSLLETARNGSPGPRCRSSSIYLVGRKNGAS